jgi:putative ABC transport system substrate-binding protein
MNRRQAIAALVALAGSSRAVGQTPAKMPRIALVDVGEHAANIAEGRPTFWSAFLVELRRLGHVEGQNLVIERWTGTGSASAEGYSELARKVIASQPRLVVVRGRNLTLALAKGTKDIPIVAIATIDPELRVNLARPGRNVTGIHLSFDSQQLYGKQVEILSGVLKPGARIAWLGSKFAWDSPIGEAARKGAASSNVTLQPVFVPNPINRPAIRRAFSEIAQARVDGLLISPIVELFPHRTSVADLAAIHKLPSLGINRYWAEAGTVIGYGVDYDEIYRRGAGYVDKILKGADPAVMPIQQPSKVELVINLETAKELGVAIPQWMLLRADRVIE